MAVINGHSILGASGAYRWFICAGSINLIKTLPPEAFVSSVFAEEGTDAHTYAAMCAKNELQPSGTHADNEFEYDGRKFTPDKEMVEHIEAYLRYCRNQGDFKQMIHGFEEKFDLSSVYPGCFGTCDYWQWLPAIGVLRVVDLKYGAGKRVYAKDNPQLMYYALGAMLKLKLPVKTVRLEIFQPRMADEDGGNAFQTHDITAAELMDFAFDLVDYCKATEPADAPLVAGDHCQFCPAKLTCPAKKSDADRLAKMNADMFKPIVPTAAPDAFEALKARVLWVKERADVLKAVIKAADEMAYAMAVAGQITEADGWKLADKKGRRKYKDPEPEIIDELRAMGYADAVILEPPALRSPAQLEIALGTGGKKIVAAFAEAKSTGLVLVPADSDRPAAAIQKPSDVLRPLSPPNVAIDIVAELPTFLKRSKAGS